MPSPIGHALAGATVAWAVDAIDRRPSSNRLVIASAVVATLPDLDLAFKGFHRSATHSLTAVLVLMIIAAAVTGGVTRWRVALICGAAWSTHLLLDWLATDTSSPRGLQLLWPFRQTYFISGWDLFPATERYQLLSLASIQKNAVAGGWEVLLLVPMALAIYLVREKALARFSAKLPRGDHASQ